MERSIVGFRRDEEGHWVAELECGHGQHMRHDPPWQSRPWTQSERGRAGMIGMRVNCLKCDRNEPPAEWARKPA
ncbi:DUF3565 domain-containing protein [Cupriavidus necator]|uniref:DUF3565 domain-containing protein n=1 Tax=Cupriavidus necator TaxID=106590 RepID=A0A367PBX7_CUPNE|nr:DUF3565 domain-containing protein [Cupriavidus necator]QQX85471.1 DUF3565 domain-containing protein [Cupriavidus necator]RCJ05372.1 DUF3565 domain-containing protein [Cupriavidus necator]